MHLAYLHYLCDGDTALNHVYQFAAAMRSLGHRIDVHAMNLARSTDVNGHAPTLRARIRSHAKRQLARYLHEPKELLWNARYFGLEVQRLRESPADILLVRDNWFGVTCVPVARRLGLPLILEVNAPVAESSDYCDQYLHVPLLPSRLEGWKLRNADAATAVSSTLKRYLVDRHGLSEGRVLVNPNGADIEAFRPAVEPDAALPERIRRAPVVGFVGSFEKWHGSEILGRMALEVARKSPEAHFLLVGDGPGLETVRQLVAPLDDRVLCTGRVPHERVPGLVASMDVGVMPESNFYGSPLKVIEWMAAGTAVVAPAYGPLRDVIDDGREGRLFPPGNVGALVAAVCELLDDADLRCSTASRAVTRVRSHLTWKDNAERVVGLCETVIDRRTGSLRDAPTQIRRDRYGAAR